MAKKDNRWWRRSRIELVKGGDLKVGDTVLVPCIVCSIDQWEHRIIRPVDGSHWNAGDQNLWTWGGKYGAGINSEPRIFRLIEEHHLTWLCQDGRHATCQHRGGKVIAGKNSDRNFPKWIWRVCECQCHERLKEGA